MFQSTNGYVFNIPCLLLGNRYVFLLGTSHLSVVGKALSFPARHLLHNSIYPPFSCETRMRCIFPPADTHVILGNPRISLITLRFPAWFGLRTVWYIRGRKR